MDMFWATAAASHRTGICKNLCQAPLNHGSCNLLTVGVTLDVGWRRAYRNTGPTIASQHLPSGRFGDRVEPKPMASAPFTRDVHQVFRRSALEFQFQLTHGLTELHSKNTTPV